ncbi:hypothetical protein Stsp01_04760 [Streptomyces sp. NBRC 13847]|nr:hypothetical protein Stsp01_04760 [Streptomyces sp. NBRC 13847]
MRKLKCLDARLARGAELPEIHDHLLIPQWVSVIVDADLRAKSVTEPTCSHAKGYALQGASTLYGNTIRREATISVTDPQWS